jgi:hypothetical protein
MSTESGTVHSAATLGCERKRNKRERNHCRRQHKPPHALYYSSVWDELRAVRCTRWRDGRLARPVGRDVRLSIDELKSGDCGEWPSQSAM